MESQTQGLFSLQAKGRAGSEDSPKVKRAKSGASCSSASAESPLELDESTEADIAEVTPPPPCRSVLRTLTGWGTPPLLAQSLTRFGACLLKMLQNPPPPPHTPSTPPAKAKRDHVYLYHQ